MKVGLNVIKPNEKKKVRGGPASLSVIKIRLLQDKNKKQLKLTPAEIFEALAVLLRFLRRLLSCCKMIRTQSYQLAADTREIPQTKAFKPAERGSTTKSK